MRLYVITSSYPRHDRDHAGSFVHAQISHLRDLGVRPDVFCWDDKLRATLSSDWPVHRVQYAPTGAQYLFYGGGAPENLTRFPGLGLLAVPAVAAMVTRLMGRPRPDVVMGQWYAPSGLIARFVGRLWGVPSVVVGHSGGIQMLDRLPGPARRIAMGLATSGISTAVSEPLAELVRRSAPGADVRVMPMGVELPDADAVIQGEGALFLGRLEPIKGVDVAIRATRMAGWSLAVAGEGSLRPMVEASGVDFLGFVSGEEKWQAIDSAQVSLHPSVPQDGRHEGLPVSLLECAARGTFPFVSGAPGVERWLEAPEHQVRRVGDPGDFSDALRWWSELSPKKQRRLAEAQRARVEPLRWESWSHRWLQLLEEAIASA